MPTEAKLKQTDNAMVVGTRSLPLIFDATTMGRHTADSRRVGEDLCSSNRLLAINFSLRACPPTRYWLDHADKVSLPTAAQLLAAVGIDQKHCTIRCFGRQ